MKLKRILLLLIMSVVLIQLMGCSGKQGGNQASQSDENALPNSLIDISMGVERIINNLEKNYEKIQEKQKKSKSEESKADEDNKSKQDKQNSNNNERKMKDLEKTLTESWEKVNQEIKSLHQSWNSYESEEVLDKQKINSIEKELNDLTEISKDEKLLATLLKINQFNLEIADLYNNYNEKIKVPLKKVEAYTRNIMYLSLLNDKEANIAKQIEDISQIKELLPQIELRFEKDKQLNNKVKELNKAIEDLEQSVKEQKKEVIKVKGELVLKKLKGLEKSK